MGSLGGKFQIPDSKIPEALLLCEIKFRKSKFRDSESTPPLSGARKQNPKILIPEACPQVSHESKFLIPDSKFPGASCARAQGQ